VTHFLHVPGLLSCVSEGTKAWATPGTHKNESSPHWYSLLFFVFDSHTSSISLLPIMITTNNNNKQTNKTRMPRQSCQRDDRTRSIESGYRSIWVPCWFWDGRTHPSWIRNERNSSCHVFDVSCAWDNNHLLQGLLVRGTRSANGAQTELINGTFLISEIIATNRDSLSRCGCVSWWSDLKEYEKQKATGEGGIISLILLLWEIVRSVSVVMKNALDTSWEYESEGTTGPKTRERKKMFR